MSKMNRRQFLSVALCAPLVAGSACHALQPGEGNAQGAPERFFFVSQGKTAMMQADGGGLRYFDFNAPNQATWQPCGFFPDGHRVLLLSMEPRRDGPGRPFEQYYSQTPTHIWTYDLERDALTEITAKERMAVFYTPQLLLGSDRLLVQVVKEGKGRIYSMNLDGTDAREFTHEGDGFPYGLSLSPDGKRVAFHMSCPGGYQVWTSNLEGRDRVQVAASQGHIYFGTSWSPDGLWVLYVDCLPEQDPGHDWAEVCIGRAAGGEHRVLTSGQAMWFSASYGNPKNRGGGSNTPAWTRDGRIVFPRRLPDSKVAWEFQAQRPDTDHFNRDFKPESARGGSQICVLDPRNGSVTELTPAQPGVWDFRASASPTGANVVFCRAAVGESPAIWVMDADGRHPSELTKGLDGLGADHPRWVPAKA